MSHTNNKINSSNSGIKKIFFGLIALTLAITGLTAYSVIQDQNNNAKNSFAAAVYSCSNGETLSGQSCLSDKASNQLYELKCKDGYTLMDTSCVKFDQKTCSFFQKGIDAENGWCKFSTTNIYGGEILNFDGRECNGTGYSFYRYNVGLELNATTGPIVCANTYSDVLGKADYRWMPKAITEISNLETIATTNKFSPCPTGFTETGDKCSRPAVVKSCDSGQTLDKTNSTTCSSCPANSYCPVNQSANLKPICGSGSTLVKINNADKCQASVKITKTAYTDGCGTGYVKYDQTCAVEQFRDRDVDVCSYYFASNNVFITASTESNGQCSTGGRTDFDSTNIFKVSDLQCAGEGSGWYNYNVAFDPLVCGYNTYNPNNKAAFRWSAKSFTKITGLQKLGTETKVCPAGWTDSGDNVNCYQDPINLDYGTPVPCPTGTTSPANSTTAATCITTVASSSSSSVVSSSSSISSSSVSSSSASSQNGSGVITITNQSSSSSSISSIISSSSIQGCISAEPGTYISGSNCLICPIGFYCTGGKEDRKPCPEGKTTATTGAKSINECIAIATVAVVNNPSAPTTRSGGLATLSFFFAVATMISGAYVYYDSHMKQSVQSGWKKLK
jgi:Tyrosine-protein kinase ephrin type A/B receptor-like